MDIRLYDYDLPEGMVALYPAEPRDSSKLLHLPLGGGKIEHTVFNRFPEFLNKDDLLVINDSRVFPARLFGRKRDTGGKVEIFLLEKTEDNVWEALVRPGRRLQPGTEVEFFDNKLIARLGERTYSGGRAVHFSSNGDLMSIIWKHGEVPLPPYINRNAEESDKTRYQTIYAENVGAVAAPTAGFHFTENTFKALKKAGVEIAKLTLHPGLGTFRPITKADAEKHNMHEEKYSISPKTADTINNAIADGRRIIAVGTTTVRALESSSNNFGEIRPCEMESTELFIKPSYDFKVIGGLLTNFHLPKSTLLLLVSALAGRERVLQAYKEAIERKYRFYSYGDAMLLL
ncbi:MAG: tRNA preQ1(34) S-adenosylmethionine ribosyltransferase-isomerase QueA [Candidatus Zixiibacteriota bacterium]|nr:MAG: tRNA preQ1(34) S-adenosylmethionine ribosyltransferase-isomerase QueA [candidate division Zixibacteria bacterium]